MNKPTDFKRIRIGLIDPSPFAIRRRKEPDLLGGSIRRFGVQSPVKVRPQAKGRYEIIFGDRRLEEAKRLGVKEINAIIERVDDNTALLQHIVENCARKDFNPIEEAEAFRRLRKLGYSNERIAKLVGKSPTLIPNRLGLLKLPEQVQKYVTEDKLSTAIAQRIPQIVPFKFQTDVANTIVERHLNGYEAAAYIAALEEKRKVNKITGLMSPELKRKPAVKEGLEKIHQGIEAKLKDAFAVDAMNITSLKIWKLAVRIQPRIGSYNRLYISKEKIIQALKEDLEALTAHKVAVAEAEDATRRLTHTHAPG